MSINRFGGFLKRSWRLNDWIWGRLDAATILCRTVLQPTRVRRAALLSGYIGVATAREQAAAQANETVDELVEQLFGPAGIPGDASLQELRNAAKAELTNCFDVVGVAPGDLSSAMPALAHLFALAVQLDVVPADLSALKEAITADVTDGANARSRGVFFLDENRDLISRVLAGTTPEGQDDRGHLLAAFDRAGIGRELLQAETSSDLMLRSGATAAAVGATVFDSPKSGLGALRLLTRGIRGAMLVIFWGITALTGKAAIARSLALLALAMGAVLVTLAAFGAVPSGLSGLAAGVGISLLLLAFAYGALRSGTMLHGLVLLTPLVPVLAEAMARSREGAAADVRGTVTLTAVLVLALGLMAIGTLPAASASVWTALSRVADRQQVPEAPADLGKAGRILLGTVRAFRGVLALLMRVGWRLLFVAVPVALAVWVVNSGWTSVADWLAAHFVWCLAVAGASLAVGVVAATHFGERLQVLSAHRSGVTTTWQWRSVAHPAGISASWAVVYGTAYLVLALVLIRDPWNWRGVAWAESLCVTALLLGVLLTLVVPVVVPMRAFEQALSAERARGLTVRPYVASADDVSGVDPAHITADVSYACDLVQRDVAYRRWVSYDAKKQGRPPQLTRAGQKARRAVYPDR
jgi:hypothetical protein